MEKGQKSSQILEKEDTSILDVLYEDLIYYTLGFLYIKDLIRLNGVTKLEVFVKTLTRSIRNYDYINGYVSGIGDRMYKPNSMIQNLNACVGRVREVTLLFWEGGGCGGTLL